MNIRMNVNMSRKLCALTALTAATLAFAAPLVKAADAEPHVLPQTVSVIPGRYGNYYPVPTAKEPQYNTWSWRPRFSFTVDGPLAGGSQISVTFFKPDGAVLMTLPCQTPESHEGEYRTITNPSDNGMDAERHTTTLTGNFTFKITLKNELTSTNKTLFTGKFTVSKIHSGPNVPLNKNQFEYYVEHDWLLPVGYMFFDTQANEEAPQMRMRLWFRGEAQPEDLAAYVFYKGKQICSTKTEGEGAVYYKLSVATPSDDKDPLWKCFQFNFNNIAAYYKQISANKKTENYLLDANPGDYEIKVLRKGKLARTIALTVGADGKIADNGVAEKNKMGIGVLVIPVKVLPGMDGRAKLDTAKTDLYYGNPPVGLILP